MILTCYFVDKSEVKVPTMDLIIASLEAYIGKMLICNQKCLTCICVAYKCHQNVLGALG